MASDPFQRLKRITLWAVLVAMSPGVALAQSTTASIIGRVTDESGSVLPGVTITATSPVLQVASISAVTDAQGDYRLTPLPIGTYTVIYELQGFQSVRHEDVRLTIGFTARQDVVLKVGTIAETVTVSGASPVVDVTATAASTEFTRETLEVIPSSRSGFSSLLAQAPGARSSWDVGGGAATEQPIFRAFGQAGEPWPSVEGIITGQMGTNGNGNYTDYASFEEARVSTIGNGAEVPTRGVAITTVVKSGSNNFHGGLSYGSFPPSLQSNNLDDTVAAGAAVNSGRPLLLRYDFGGELGGRIIRDRLWFYGSARRRRDVQEEFTGVKSDGTPAENNQLLWGHTQKVQYQMTTAQKLVLFAQYQHKFDVSEASEFRAWESRSNKPTMTQMAKVEYQATLGTSMVLSAQTSYWKYRTYYFGIHHGPYASDQPAGVSRTDLFTGYTSGEFDNVGRRAKELSFQQRASLSWYKPDFIHGSHNVKVGIEYIDTLNSPAYVKRPATSGEYQLVFDNGVPRELRTWNTPTKPMDYAHNLGVYVTDSWSLSRKLTLNLGVRFTHNPGFINEGCREAVDFAPASCWERIEFVTYNSVVPRLHAAYDITGDGKTLIKGGWGRFAHLRYPTLEVGPADPNLRSTTRWRWTDPNGNGLYDPGEVDLDPNGPAFIAQSGGSNTRPNPNEKQPYQDELYGSLERQVMTDFAARLTGVYSRAVNSHRLTNVLRPPSAYTIQVNNPDPGEDGLVGTADDTGETITYYEFPATLAGRAFELFQLSNSDQTVTFSSFEVALSKRQSNNWQMQASFSATKRNIPYINGLDPTEQGSSTRIANDTPNDEIFAADRTWEWTGKFSGAYQFPKSFMLSANFEHRSGEPWARQVLVRGGATIPSITLRVEPIGTRRLPHRNLTNVRLQKILSLGAGQRVELRANVYNLFNANTVMNVVKRAGPNFGQPTPGAAFPAIMEPRIYEFSLSYVF